MARSQCLCYPDWIPVVKKTKDINRILVTEHSPIKKPIEPLSNDSCAPVPRSHACLPRPRTAPSGPPKPISIPTAPCIVYYSSSIQHSNSRLSSRLSRSAQIPTGTHDTAGNASRSPPCGAAADCRRGEVEHAAWNVDVIGQHSDRAFLIHLLDGRGGASRSVPSLPRALQSIYFSSGL